jgi:hypothetical protein
MITVEDIKTALGLDPQLVDPIADQSLQVALALVWSYIGFNLTETTVTREYEYTPDYHDQASRRNFVHLPLWPVIQVLSITDENLVPITGWRLSKETGRVDFQGGLPSGEHLLFQYNAGYSPLPDDLEMVITNLAGAVYNNGGTIQASANPLKSLTMFDAMSMSFDTGVVTSTGASALLEPWGFVLNKYRVNAGPVLK